MNVNTYIYITDEITDKIKSVKISQSYEGYKARLIIIGTGASQGRMIAYGEKSTISKSASAKDLPIQNVDVSLQKYITKVTSYNNTVTYDNQTERKNKYADKDENFITDKTSLTHQGVEISNKTGEKVNNKNTEYKSANTVKIEPGDTVEYTIKVYNNSDQKVKVTAKDVIDNRAEMLSSYTKDKNNTYFLCKDETFAANETKTFTVKLKYSEYTEDKIMNKAWIASTNPSNKNEHRTVDADYVQMKKYSVSLEKYVTAVGNTSITRRENNPIYASYYDYNNDGKIDDNDSKFLLRCATGLEKLPKDKIGDLNGDGKVNSLDAQKHASTLCNIGELSKQNNPVPVELGDEVTYTIKLTNTGDTVIKVTEIEDVFDGNNNADIEYVKDSATGYGTATVKEEKGKLTITIANPEEINPEESKYLTLKFKVKANKEASKEEQLLINTAEVTKITNKNGDEVTDSDGNQNNKDSDWIKTQIYAVSLEKYVTAVGNTSITGRENNPIYASYYDYNNDGKIDDNDSKFLLRCATGLEKLPKDKIGDLNGDGKVNSLDAQKHASTLCNIGELSKQNNPVPVELGDEVTYTIKLTNTGSTVIKVAKLKDVYDGNDYANIKYIENSATGYGKGAKVEGEHGDKTITIIEPEEIAPGTSKYLTLRFKVDVPVKNTSKEQVLKNTMEVTDITNKDGVPVSDSDGNENNKDSDWIKTQIYAVSLEKFITKVNGNGLSEEDKDREGKAVYLTKKSDETYVNETHKDSKWTLRNTYKKDEKRVVTVSQGDVVEYTIKVKNDGKTSVYVTEIADIFPEGVTFGEVEGDGKKAVTFTNLAGKLIPPGGTEEFTVEVVVTEPDSSTRTLENTAEITKMSNKNKEEVEDSTPYDNKDLDYIDLNYDDKIIIEEFTSYSVEKVWNDDDNKNGKRPESVTVELYREGESKPLGKVELTENNWTYEWTELEKYDKDKNEYQYYVEEKTVKDYTTAYDKDKNHTKITNTYGKKEEVINIKVQKYWHREDSESVRPDSIKVQLKKNGKKEGKEVELNKDNNWSCEWKNLDKAYTYDVEEVEVPEGYNVGYNISASTSADTIIYSIHNTYIGPPASYSVEKVWADNNDKAEKRPTSVTVKLYRLGEEKALEEVKLNSENNWQYEWTGLEKRDAEGNEYQYYAVFF